MRTSGCLGRILASAAAFWLRARSTSRSSRSCWRFPAAAMTMLPPLYVERWNPAMARRLIVEITSRVPITGRPSGCDPKTASEKRSWTSSCGVSSYIAISSSTTSRSASSSARDRRDDDVAPVVRRAVEPGDRPPADRRDHVPRADHGPPERVRAEDRLREEVVDQLLRRVLVHRDLLEHDLALGVELGEGRAEDHVGHHVDGGLEVGVGHARVDDGVLARGGRVQLAPEAVEDLRDLLGGVGARAFEEQVLDEVRDARAVVPLVARPRTDPEAERDRADARHALRHDALPRIEFREDVLLHRLIVPGATPRNFRWKWAYFDPLQRCAAC